MDGSDTRVPRNSNLLDDVCMECNEFCYIAEFAVMRSSGFRKSNVTSFYFPFCASRIK